MRVCHAQAPLARPLLWRPPHAHSGHWGSDTLLRTHGRHTVVSHPCMYSSSVPQLDPPPATVRRDTRTSILVALHTLLCAHYVAERGDTSVPCLYVGRGQRQEKVSCCTRQPSATGGTLSLLPSRLVQTKAAAASVPPGAAGPGGSMCAVPPLSAAILSICIWRAAINAPHGACSLPPPPDPLLSVDKPQNGLLLG